MYQHYNIPWLLDHKNNPEEYFVPWLSVYPNKEITLSLRVQIHKTKKEKATETTPKIPAKLLVPQTLRIAYEHEFFELKFAGQPGVAIPNAEDIDNPAMHYLDITIKEDEDYKLLDQLTLKCIKELPQQKTIRVIADCEECGYLKVLPNDASHQKQVKILRIPVKANIVGKEINTGVIKATPELERVLNQALINPVFTDIPAAAPLNLTKNADDTSDSTMKQFSSGSNIKIGSQVTTYFRGKTNGNTNQPLPEFMSLFNYLDAKLESQFKNADGTPMYDDSYIKLYYLGEKEGILLDENGDELTIGGQGKQENGIAHAILFTSISNIDIAHEILHALGLEHSFGSIDQHAPYYFEWKQTENIMDYTHLDGKEKYSTWKWQWAQLQANTTQVIPIK